MSTKIAIHPGPRNLECQLDQKYKYVLPLCEKLLHTFCVRSYSKESRMFILCDLCMYFLKGERERDSLSSHSSPEFSKKKKVVSSLIL